jgi:prepilin-type N-terminal cleavage/methylation domain-containing protein
VTRASGFTLLEVLVAIVLASIVALVAYGAAQVSFDVRARLGGALRAQQSARATRELLQDALRNARRAPQGPEDTTFVLHEGRLTFVSAGAGPPFDPDYDWRITIEPDSGGLALVAIPVGRAPAAEVAFRLPGVTQWGVQVLTPDEPRWVREWPATPNMPCAIAITLWNRAEPVGPPLQLALTTTTTPMPGELGVP